MRIIKFFKNIHIFNLIILILTYLVITSPKLFYESSIKLIDSDTYYNEISLTTTCFLILFCQFFGNLSGLFYFILLLMITSVRHAEIFHYKLFGFGYEPITFSQINLNNFYIFFESFYLELSLTIISLIMISILSLKLRFYKNYIFTLILIILSIRGIYLMNLWGGLDVNSKNKDYSSEISLILAFNQYNEKFNYVLNQRELEILDHEFIHLPDKIQKLAKREIFLIYLESFSHNFFSKELTPFLFNILNHKLVFNNFINSSTPTINAIISGQCSIFPQTGFSKEGGFRANINRYNQAVCLGDILKRNNYYLSYIQAADSNFSSKGNFFKNHQFDEFLGRDEIQHIYPKISNEESNFWGITDRQLFEIATHKLLELKEKKPFLFSLININSHSPGFFSKKCMIKEDIQIIKSIKCMDFYLSKYLLEIRKFFPEAIIILTGDHVAGPNNFLRKKVKDEFLESSYDRTLLIIDDPLLNTSKIDTNVFSITPDLFPTIIELLNGKEKKIHFGKSILSERQKNQEIISPEFQIKERIYNIPTGLSHKICVEEKEISEILHNCTRKRIFNYAENNFFPLN